jgi:hypothetical protein
MNRFGHQQRLKKNHANLTDLENGQRISSHWKNTPTGINHTPTTAHHHHITSNHHYPNTAPKATKLPPTVTTTTTP